MSPQRIQRRLIKGWLMPEGAVYVGRGSKWGNPYRVVYDRQRRGYCVHLGDYDRIWGPGISITEAEKDAVARYRTALLAGWHGLAPEMLHELRGKDLACWCGPGHRCHADVLLELANRETAP